MKKSKIELVKKIGKKAFAVFCILLGFFSAGLVIYFILVLSKGYYHSDCTDTIFWAQASYEGGALMNPEFRYAALLPFGGQLIMLPFVAMFGVTMKAQLMGMVVFFCIFLLALIFLCKSMGLSYRWSSLTVAVTLLILSSSEKMREIFWSHIIYYSLGALFFMVGFALILNIIRDGERLLEEKSTKQLRKVIVWYVLLAVWTLLSSTNGIQALTIYALPVVAALAAERFFDVETKLWDKKSRIRYLIILVMIVSVIAGLLLGRWINKGIVAWYADAFSKFSKPSEWMTNLLNFFPGFFTLLGVKVENDVLIYSFKGICNLLRVIFSLILMGIPVLMLFMYRRFEHIMYRLLILVHHFLTILLLLGWVFGLLSAANWRLSPMLVTASVLCILFVKWMLQYLEFKRMAAIVLIPLACMMMIVTIDILTMKKQSDTTKGLVELAEFLEDHDLEYGYATFWQANIITLLSDSEVKVRDIRLIDGYVEREYQSNENWYAKADGYDQYFVILTDSEYTEWKEQMEQGIYEEPSEYLTCGWYQILVYDYNLFA